MIDNRAFFNLLSKYHNGKEEPLHETTAVLCYEVGRMLEHAMYLYWKPEDSLARLGFYKSELMDAIAQLELICQSLNISFDEMRGLGQEKAIERFTKKEIKN